MLLRQDMLVLSLVVPGGGGFGRGRGDVVSMCGGNTLTLRLLVQKEKEYKSVRVSASPFFFSPTQGRGQRTMRKRGE